MKIILSKILYFLKIILMFIGMGLILLGLLLTNKRLGKPLTDSISSIIPFVLLIIMTFINIFYKKAKLSENLLFNFTSCILFIVIIFIGYRAKFDTNMLLYHKYQINYDPNYLANNLSSIQVMIYCLVGANVFYILKSLLEPHFTKDINYEQEKKPQNYQYGVEKVLNMSENEPNKEELL